MGKYDMVEQGNIILARDGVFPITRDKVGHPLPIIPASGLSIPGTIQGEGKLNGMPSLFIRLAGCNLNCCWTTAGALLSPCDTAYASYEIKGAYSLPTEDVYALVQFNTNNIRHIVITGGEPFLQANELKKLCWKLKANNQYHLTIETNATVYSEGLSQYIDLFSLSPKLSSSQPTGTPKEEYQNRNCIQGFINYARKHNKDFQLKFVYAHERDITEIHELLSHLQDWHNEDILLMPVGGAPEIMRINALKVSEHCIRNGWRYCDRLHLSLFGAKEGA